MPHSGSPRLDVTSVSCSACNPTTTQQPHNVPMPQEGFERKDVGDDCRARATALHMHLYNTTALKARRCSSAA